MQFLDLGAHLHAQLGVEVGQRLVEQEDLRIAHDRPAHRDALTLTARQLPRITIQIGREAEILAAEATRSAMRAGSVFLSFSEKAMLSLTFICG